MAERQIGPFAIIKQLGAGGMGVVYLAKYDKTGQQVALKVLSPDIADDAGITARFEREIEILKKLKHPNIVKYYGGGTQDRQRFYAMEVVNGGSLEEMIEKQGKIPWDKAIPIAKQICEALQHAHDAGVIHRDLKPANLLITREGSLKLTDFGIARDNSRTALTAAGKTVGTYAYMAPEQITGKTLITRKTDLYALGCVIFEMLTGRPPFEGDQAAQTLFKHIEEEPPRVRDLNLDCPIWLDQLVVSLLSKEPEERPYDAYAVTLLLDDVVKKVKERTNLESIAKKATKAGDVTVAGTKVLGTKKKKKKQSAKDDSPIYEKTWFLATGLAAIVGLVIWLNLPLSDTELFKRGEQLMASQENTDHDRAKVEYFEVLLKNYPDSQFAERAKSYIDDIEMNVKERQIESRMKRGKEAESEAERVFREAKKYEDFGDRISAMDKYQGLINLLKDKQEDKPVINLARRELTKLKSEAAQFSERGEFIRKVLNEAEALYSKGQIPAARLKWENIIALYANNQEFAPLVEEARKKLDEKFEKK